VEYDSKTEERIDDSQIKKSTMRCIRCPECGAEILMIPTLRKMIEAIENHISTHRKQSYNKIDGVTLKPAHIRTSLTEQVLELSSEMLEASQKPPLWLQQE
jgi:DNA-directed RNA polymerase subunit RPC12/RpoP